jgi:hypothetical protein
LLLAEALADHLIDGRFHKAGANPLSSPIALPIIGPPGAHAGTLTDERNRN